VAAKDHLTGPLAPPTTLEAQCAKGEEREEEKWLNGGVGEALGLHRQQRFITIIPFVPKIG